MAGKVASLLSAKESTGEGPAIEIALGSDAQEVAAYPTMMLALWSADSWQGTFTVWCSLDGSNWFPALAAWVEANSIAAPAKLSGLSQTYINSLLPIRGPVRYVKVEVLTVTAGSLSAAILFGDGS